MKNGALFAVPIPHEYETVGLQLQKAVEQTLEEAERQGVNRLGKAVTPWLLKRVGELTAGKSIDSSQCRSSDPHRNSDKYLDIALIKNTARVGT